MIKESSFDKDYFERGPYGKQDIQIIRRNYKILLENAKVANFLPSNPRQVLDFGCAYGAGTTFLSEQFQDAHIVGVDISEYAIDKAQAYYKRGNIDYYCLNLSRPDRFDFLKERYGVFDLIFSRDTLEHIALDKQEEIIVVAFAELLKEDGTVIAQTPNKLNPFSYEDKTHIGLRSAKSWKILFKKFFRDVNIFEKQFLPIIWKFRESKELLEFTLPIFGYNIYIFARLK